MDKIHHVAITVEDLKRAVEWYTKNFDCKVAYQDDTWAMLEFQNIQLALVLPTQHPAHVGFERINAEKFGKLTKHRDGRSSVYIQDPEGNSIEILDKK